MEFFLNSKNYDSIYLFQGSLQNELNKMGDVGVSDGVNREIFFLTQTENILQNMIECKIWPNGKSSVCQAIHLSRRPIIV